MTDLIINKEMAVDICGSKWVLLGRLCRKAGVPYNHGMEVAKKHQEALAWNKEVIVNGKSKTQCVVIPLIKLPRWLDLLNPAAFTNAVRSTELGAYQIRTARGEDLPFPTFINRALAGEDLSEIPTENPKRENETLSAIELPPATNPTSKDNIFPIKKKSAIVEKAEKLAEIEHQVNKLASRISKHEKDASKLRQEIIALAGGESSSSMMTVAEYCAKHRINLDSDRASALGRVASGYCKTHGISTGTAPHPHYKSVKTYPSDAIEYAISQQGGAA